MKKKARHEGTKTARVHSISSALIFVMSIILTIGFAVLILITAKMNYDQSLAAKYLQYERQNELFASDELAEYHSYEQTM